MTYVLPDFLFEIFNFEKWHQSVIGVSPDLAVWLQADKNANMVKMVKC